MTELEKSEAIIKFIANAEKTTPVELYTDEEVADKGLCRVIGKDGLKLVIGDWKDVEEVIKNNNLKNYYLKNDRRNSGVPMLDIKNINARIEPGAIIRDKVTIGDKAVIMMGAVINIGAEIGAQRGRTHAAYDDRRAFAFFKYRFVFRLRQAFVGCGNVQSF